MESIPQKVLEEINNFFNTYKSYITTRDYTSLLDNLYNDYYSTNSPLSGPTFSYIFKILEEIGVDWIRYFKYKNGDRVKITQPLFTYFFKKEYFKGYPVINEDNYESNPKYGSTGTIVYRKSHPVNRYKDPFLYIVKLDDGKYTMASQIGIAKI